MSKIMRGLARTAIILPAALLCITLNAHAVDADISAELKEIALSDQLRSALPSEIPSQISELAESPSSSVNLPEAVKSVLTAALAELTVDFKSAVRQTVCLFAVSALCGIFSAFSDPSQPLTASPISLCAAAAIAAPGIGRLSSAAELCENTVSRMCTLSYTLFPSVAAACGASGSPTSGIASSAAALTVTSVVMSVMKNVFLPSVYLYIIGITVNSLVENELIKKAADVIKFCITEGMKWITFLYLSYSGISSAISAAADMSAIKAAKMAISGAIPIIGSIVSDSAGVVLSGAAIIKNSIGIIGIVSIIAICAAPFMRVGLLYLSYKLSAALSSAVAPRRVSGLADGIGTAFGMWTGLVGTVAVLLFISIVLSVVMVRPA